MKKEEYLRKLKYQLMDLPGEDLSQVEDFYEELIYDGMEQGLSEEEILAGFESPEDVAKKIRAEYGGLAVYTAKGGSKEKNREKTQGYASSELIHTVRIETENLRIRVKSIEEGPVRVYFKQKEGQDQVTFEEKDGVFFFKHEMKGKNPLYLNWLNFFLEMNVLVVELPVNYSGKLSLKTTNGSIRVSGLGNLSCGEIDSNNGMIKMENSYAEKLTIKTNNARIELANVRGEQLDVSAGNGMISVKECRFVQRLSLQTQNGTVTGRNLISDDISLQTCNGIVSGTIIGNRNDYNINSFTRNGFNNLENVFEPERAKKLLAKTHNGRIQIEFTM